MGWRPFRADAECVEDYPVSDPKALLPQGLGDAVEQAAGAVITQVVPRGGGGASRSGAELSLQWPDGTVHHAYMNYDVDRAGAGDDAAFLREAGILRALSGPLREAGVRTAPYITSVPDMRALVTAKVAGEANFYTVRDPALRSAIAADLMAQLAALHGIDVATVDGLGDVHSVHAEILARIGTIRAHVRAHGDDPLIHLALDWLEANMPPEPDHVVVVHGDWGAGNFMFEGDRVTALLDWELVHFGDPMADMAMLCLRGLFQPLVPLPEAFAAYEAAGGDKVDLDRVRYWRLLFQTGFASRAHHDDPNAPPPPNLGMNMVYSMVHRRVLADALAQASGVVLPDVAMPDAMPGALDRSFIIALDDLRDIIVPRLADQQASVKAKGLARLVKWWQAHARYGAGYEAAERDELSHALGRSFTTRAQGRDALRDAVLAGTIDRAVAVGLVHARVTRENALMADAMGGLATTRFAPLE